jgi:methionyl-tRNA formyltransferase
MKSPVWMQVRAFVGWPGTQAVLLLRSHDGTADREMEVKVTRTRVSQEVPQSNPSSQEGFIEASHEGQMLISCGGGSVLQVLELQPAGKKPMSATAFLNGVKGRSILVRLAP